MASKNRIRSAKANAVKQDTNLGISYEGTVTVAYQRKNKVYKAQIRHNKGMFPMFELLANALTGNVKDIANTKPKYIRLFHIEEGEEEIFNQSSEMGASNIPYTEIWNTYDSSNNEASANFQFVIPYTYLSTDGDPADIGINEIAIYNNKNQARTNIEHPSAYVVLEKIDEKTQKKVYDYLIADGKSNVVITWTMTIKNNGE